MDNKQPRFEKATLVLGAAMVTLLCLPCPVHAQSSTSQDRPAVQSQDQDRQAVTGDQDRQGVRSEDTERSADRRDVASFDQWLDSHREIAEQVRKDPSLLDNRNFVQSHPALQTYLQDNPGVRDQIRQNANSFMRQEDAYDHDTSMRDRGASGQDRDFDRRDAANRDVANFGRFLDGHREIAEQVRKDPSLLDNRNFVQSHPALQTYLQDNPGVRDQLRQQSPNSFMRQEDAYDHDTSMRDRGAGGQDRDFDRRDAANRDVANFGRFLDGHREIAEQLRKDPSLLDNRNFVQSHPALQTYLQDNPGVRDQLRQQSPNGFMRQEDAYNRDTNTRDRDRDPMHDHMADFGGFLHSHADIQKDLSRDPSRVKDHEYVRNHAELDAYLNAHPDMRAELMANPQSFVQGAQQYHNASPSGTSSGAGVNTGAGMNSHGTSPTGAGTRMEGTGTAGSTTGTSTNPAPTTHEPPKPKQ